MRRLDDIDGLRAVAILTVAVFHARVHLLGAAGIDWLSKEGSHGVDLFFVLSGFCLAYPTLEKLRIGGGARFNAIAFALKRFLRIVPPYLAVLTILAAAAWFGAAHGLQLPDGMKALSLADLIDNVLFLDQQREFVNASFWTLAVEFRWYFIFPLALLLAARSMRAFLSVTLLVAVAGEFTRAASLDIDVLPAFLLGIAAAHIRVNEHPIARYALPIGVFAFAYAILEEQTPHFPIQTNLGWHVVTFAFVVAAGVWTPLRKALGFGPLAKIGVASYSIYLVHEPVESAVVQWLNPLAGPALATLGAVTAGVIAGFALWALIERGLTRRSTVERFVTRWTPQTSALFGVLGFPHSFEMRTRTAGGPALPLSAIEPPAAEPATVTVRDF